MMLRVAFVDQSGGHGSGAQESLALLLQALPSDIEPIVIVFGDGPFAERLRSAGYEVVVHGVGDRFQRASRFGPYALSALTLGGEIARLAALFRRIKPDIVHTNTVKAHVLAVPAARLCGVPSVMHLRDSLDGGGKLLLTALARNVASRVVAVSHRLAAWYAIPSTRIVYNPVRSSDVVSPAQRAEARSALGIGQGAPCIGIIGPIHRMKGHDRFLRALGASLRQTALTGIVVGDSRFTTADAIPAIRRQAEVLGVGSHVRFVPWLEDIGVAYASLDVLCNCSTREPFGRTIVEAAARGIPSVIFDDAGAAELFVDGVSASIAPAHDESAYAQRVTALATNEDLRRSVGLAARGAVAELTLEDHARAIVAVYADLVRRPPIGA